MLSLLKSIPQKIFQYLVNRGKERSTWEGFAAILAGTGALSSPDQIQWFVALGVSVVGFIRTIIPDQKPPAE